MVINNLQALLSLLLSEHPSLVIKNIKFNYQTPDLKTQHRTASVTYLHFPLFYFFTLDSYKNFWNFQTFSFFGRKVII